MVLTRHGHQANGSRRVCQAWDGRIRIETAWVLYGQASRSISTGQLHTLLRFHTQPINVVVFNGPSGISRIQGDLILGGASRLDAFSGYPVRT